MDPALTLAGVLLLGLTAWDTVVTVLSTQGAGLVTEAWTRAAWRLTLSIHRRRPMHRALSMVGPLMLLGVIWVWYVLLLAGWLLIFAKHPYAVTDQNGNPTAVLEKLYFLGVTVSGLGYGDLTPSDRPWTLLSSMAAFSGTVILTTSLSYILAIVSAAIERETLAARIFAIADSPHEFIESCWVGPSDGSLDDYMLQEASAMIRLAHQHLSYPLLHFFHSAEPHRSPARAVLLYADALFVAGCLAEGGPPSGPRNLMLRSIDNYLELTHFGCAAGEEDDHSDSSGADGLLAAVRDVQLPMIPERAAARAVREYAPRRRKLLALCREDGWLDC